MTARASLTERDARTPLHHPSVVVQPCRAAVDVTPLRDSRPFRPLRGGSRCAAIGTAVAGPELVRYDSRRPSR